MKKYKYALLSLTLVIGIVTAAFLSGLFKIDKTVGYVETENDTFYACSYSQSKEYYYTITADSLNVRSGPGTSYGIVGSKSKNERVTVGCTTNGWGRISSTSDKYISLSYAKKVNPTINLGNINKSTETFYKNKSFSGNITLSYADLPHATSRLSLTLENADGNFDVNVTRGGGEVTLNFQSLAGVSEGIYTIIAKKDGDEIGRKSFTVEKNEFYFNLNKYETISNVVENEQGEWIFSISDQIPSSLNINDFDYTITKNNVDASEYFDISIRDGNLVVKNKKMIIEYRLGKWVAVNKGEYASKGTYRVTLTFKNPDDYTGTFSKSQSFTINKKRTSFTEDASARRFVRYQIDYKNEDYDVDIIGTTKEGETTKYILDEHNADGTTTRVIYSDLEMNQVYPNIRLSAIYTESRISYKDPETGNTIKPVAINFGNTIYITNFNKNDTEQTVTYYAGQETTPNTMTLAEFQTEYPSAYEQLISTSYRFALTGDIMQKETGVGTKVIKKITSIPNLRPLAVTGGEVHMAVKFSGFEDEELQEFKAELRNKTNNQLIVDTLGTVRDANFNISFDTSDMAEGIIYIVVKYLDNKEKYIGDYRVNFGFGNYNFNTLFELYDGNVDYTVFSEVDTAGTSNDPLNQQHPQANKKYDYNIGLYIKKARNDYDKLGTLDYRIYDKRIDIDEDGNYYFYDEIEYVTKIKRIFDGKVYFQLSLDNGENYTAVQSMTIQEFRTSYSEAYEYIKDYTEGKTTLRYYNLDENGNIISDNYQIHPIRMYQANEKDTDMTLDYTDAEGTVKTVLMDNTFKRANSSIYGLISTRFGYDANGRYVLGAIRGRRKENFEMNKDVNDHNVTDLFYVKKAERTRNTGTPSAEQELTKKALKILPKDEVPPGQYFVYVSHEGSEAIGFLYTDNSYDSAIELAIYPELYNRNIHMTSISYSAPSYNITINDPIETNSINKMPLAYANTLSKLTFNLQLNYIYNHDNLNYRVEYLNERNKWVDASEYFFVNSQLYLTNQINDSNYDTKGLTDSQMELITRPGFTKKGNYRLVFDYSNNGVTMPSVVKEFSIRANNYGVSINPEEVVRLTSDGTQKFETFYSNQKYDIQIPIHLYTVEHPENLEFELIYNTTGDVDPWIKENKEFRSYRDHNIVIFKYGGEIVEISEEESIYYMRYSNYVGSLLPQAAEGKYILIVRYQEDDGIVSETRFEYTVSEPKREFNAIEEKDKAVSNQKEMYITREIESSYIVGSRLVSDEISYAIEMYKDGKYVDVSSDTADTKYFDISMKWKDTDVVDRINYYGDMKINLAVDKVEDIFEASDNNKFILVISLSNVRYEVLMPNIRELFKWGITEVDISGEVENDGVTIPIKGFYNNAKPTIDIKLKTPHEENAKFAITQECSGNVCSPSEDMINYNDRFDIVSQTNNEIILKQKEDLPNALLLNKGKYQIVVYYTKTDYDIYDFNVRNEYVSIEFGESHVTTPVKGGISNDLFVNKDSVIEIPVNVIGASYDDVTIDISNNNQSVNYNHLFSINKERFVRDHILEITYDSKKNIEAGDYLIMVHKTVDEETIEDHEVFKFNSTFFNYMITGVTYDPDPAVPNYENDGEIIFDITTDELFTGEHYTDAEIKREFIKNITINNSEIPNPLTDKFKITYQDTSSITDFKIILRYSSDSMIWPGEYKAVFQASKGTYSLQKEQDFFVDSYERRITIEGVDIESNTKDNLIHKNTGGKYIVNYLANYELNINNLYVKVTDGEGTDVTDKFSVDVSNENKAILTFDPELHTINYGIYNVLLTYADPVTHRDNTSEIEIIMYGDYKEVTIKDINPSVSPIIAENEGQYYNFTLDISNLTETEINSMKIRVYDRENNIVYSNVSSDAITNSFDVVSENHEKYKINILPYKARVGSYFVEFILPASFDPNNQGLQNVSNRLEFTVDDTLYKVKLNDSSSVITQKRINNTDDIYDYIGVNGHFDFTSNSPIKDEYSIKVFNKLKLVKEINVDVTENLSEIIDFSADEISNGDVEFALCIRGLPYTSITKEVLEYIKITDLAVVIDNHDVTDELTLNIGDNKDFELVITPNDATDKNLVFKSSDENIATFNGKTITVKSAGEATITISNKEISHIFKLIVSENLESNVYEVDQNAKTIFVNHMDSKMLSKREFIRNILHLSDSYKILDKGNNNITSTTDVIGTGYKIVNGNFTYTIIVIGDVNGNGLIDLGDVTYLNRISKSYVNPDAYVLRAAKILKNDIVQQGDVTKLYRFFLGRIYEI